MSEHTYINYYRCEACDVTWQDGWDCACNDKCPKCHKEIEPYKSDEVVAFPMPDRTAVAKPRNIELIEGCVANDLLVDGRSLYFGDNRVTAPELEELTDYLVRRLREELKAGTVSFQQLLEMFQYVRYETDDTPCGQCGDRVGRTYYEI